MANFQDGCYTGGPGYALIAKVLAGRCQMRYTRVAVGGGNIPEGVSPKAMTEPAGFVMHGRISAVSNPVDGECQVTVQIHSKDVETGFFVTGLLLYAEDPDEGEVPYTYLYLENEPEWIRPSSAVVGKLATFDIIAAVGGVDDVFADIDPEAIVTAAQVENMLKGKQDKLTGEAGQIPVFGADGELEARDFSGAATFAFTAEDWGKPASVELAEGETYDGAEGYEIVVTPENHGRKSGDFGFHVFHLVDGTYTTNTWAAFGTEARYEADGNSIVLWGENPYSGKILFVG